MNISCSEGRRFNYAIRGFILFLTIGWLCIPGAGVPERAWSDDYSPMTPNLSSNLPKNTVDIRPEVEGLETWRKAEQQKLRDAGKATHENFEAIDNEFLRRARAMEGKRSQALEALAKKSGVSDITQGPGGTAPEQGRGSSGDIDTRSYKGQDYDRILKGARKAGYKVKYQGDAFTIPELNVTVHREPTPYTSATGSSARQAETGRGYNKETAYGMTSKDPNVAVHDNLKKAAQHLDTPPEQLTGPDLQELGKMTGRNMEAGRINDPALKEQCDMLKAGKSPEASRIVRDNATPRERIQDLSDFQSRTARTNQEAAAATAKHAAGTERALAKSATNAEAWYKHCKAEGDPNAISQAKAKMQAAKEELAVYREQQGVSREAAVRSSKSAAKISAEASGARLPENASPSQIRETVVGGERAKVSEVLNPEGIAPVGKGVKISTGSKIIKGAGGLLMIYGIYQGIKEAYSQTVEESGKGDNGLVSVAKLGAYSIWHGLGIASALQTGKEAGEASAEQWKKDVEEGLEDKNSVWGQRWARVRGAGWAVAKFTGLQDIKDFVVEGSGAIKDSLQAQKDTEEAEKTELHNQEVREQMEKEGAAKAGLKSASPAAGADQKAKTDIPPAAWDKEALQDCAAYYEQELSKIKAHFMPQVSDIQAEALKAQAQMQTGGADLSRDSAKLAMMNRLQQKAVKLQEESQRQLDNAKKMLARCQAEARKNKEDQTTGAPPSAPVAETLQDCEANYQQEISGIDNSYNPKLLALRKQVAELTAQQKSGPGNAALTAALSSAKSKFDEMTAEKHQKLQSAASYKSSCQLYVEEKKKKATQP